MKTTLLLILATLNLGISQTAWSMTDQDTKQIAVKYSSQFPKADGTDPYNSSIEIFLKTPTVHLILIRTNIQSYQIGCSFKVLVDSTTGLVIEKVMTSNGLHHTDESWDCSDFGSDYGGGT